MNRFLARILEKKLKKPARPFCSAVVAAAGKSSRMGGENKIFSLVGGRPVLRLTLDALCESEYIDEVVVVVRSEDMAAAAEICRACGSKKLAKLIRGGEERADSVMRGLEAISKDAEYVAIHDGARPFVTAEIIDKTVALAIESGAAAPCLPIKDTVKRVSGGAIIQTVERDTLRAAQTPQVFDAALIKAALYKAKQDGASLTDDCSAVERLGKKIACTEGSEENNKITTPFDLKIAEIIAAGRYEV